MILDLKITDTIDGDNTIAGDLHLVDGDVVWLEEVAEAIAQHIKARLRMFKEEWFLNADEGVPWFDEIFEKGTSDSRISAILRQAIAGTPGVASVPSLAIVRDRAARSIAVSFEAVTDEGTTIVSSDYGDFVILV